MTADQDGLSAEEVIGLLGLAPHPEGGFFRETFRDAATTGSGRASSTGIYFLLPADQISHWHRVDAAEVWHWHAGAPLELTIATERTSASGEPGQHHRQVIVLGNRLRRGERPQGVVPASAWQQARSLGAWTLVGCTVAPGFEFSGFELAPPGWEPA